MRERKAACFRAGFRDDLGMAVPYKTNGPVTLNETQILELHQKLRDMRHDVNNMLMNMVAAAELIRMRPERGPELFKLLLDQPPKATESIAKFSRDFEGTFGLMRP
jgi:hypothetical protein